MSQDQASATQSVQDNAAQAITYTDTSTPQATASAPATGPAESASQSGNPALTPVAPPNAETKPLDTVLSALDKGNTAHDWYETGTAVNMAAKASAGAKTYGDSAKKFTELGEDGDAVPKGIGKVMGPVGKVLSPINAGLAIVDTVAAEQDIEKNGASPMNVANLVRGGVEGAGAFGAATKNTRLSAAATTGVVAYDATGAAVNAADDEHYAGNWGDAKNETAEHRAVDAGRWVDAHTGDHDPDHPSVLGGATAVAATAVMAPIGAAQNVYNRAMEPVDMSAIDHPYAGLSGPVIQAAQQGWAAAPPGMDTQPAPSFSAKDLGMTDNSVGKSPVPQAPAQQSGSNPQKRSAAAAMADVDAMMKEPLTIGGSE